MPILEHNKHSIYYETFGNPKHPCLILISGLNGQLINWLDELITKFVSLGLYIIIFDNRDVGLSSYYDHLPSQSLAEALAIKQRGGIFTPPYTLKDMSEDIINLMDGLNIPKAHLVGISMGGMIAQILALEHPERALSLTCIATTSGDPHLPSAKPEVLKYFFLPKKPVTTINEYIDDMMELYKIYHHPEHQDEAKAREQYIQSYERAYHPEGFKRQLLAMLAAKPRGEQLKKLQIPSLIFHGDRDPVFPLEHGKYLADCLPNSYLSIVEKLGHGLPACTYDLLIKQMGKVCL